MKLKYDLPYRHNTVSIRRRTSLSWRNVTSENKVVGVFFWVGTNA